MPSLVRYGFPLFWWSLGVIQWYWPAAIFTGFSNEDVTPGARAFAITWMVIGTVLAVAFVPVLSPFGGWFVLGAVLVTVGACQRLWPAWSAPVSALDDRSFGVALAAAGVGVLLYGLL